MTVVTDTDLQLSMHVYSKPVPEIGHVSAQPVPETATDFLYRKPAPKTGPSVISLTARNYRRGKWKSRNHTQYKHS